MGAVGLQQGLAVVVQGAGAPRELAGQVLLGQESQMHEGDGHFRREGVLQSAGFEFFRLAEEHGRVTLACAFDRIDATRPVGVVNPIADD